MKKLSRILVVVDPRQRSSPAIERCADLARRTGATLHLCMVGHKPEDAAFERQSGEWLEQQAAALTALGLTVNFGVVHSWEPERAILAKVLELRPDLVARDMHRQSQYQWLVLSPEEDWLRNTCPAPLLLVRPTTRHLPHRILAAVDTGRGRGTAEPVNRAIVRIAQAIGAATDADVHLAHVFPHQLRMGDVDHILGDAEAEERAAGEDGFAQFARLAGFDAGHSHWMVGKPSDALVEKSAQLGAELLVLGASYHGWLRDFLQELVGSTGERLVAATQCDVLFVKPDDFRSELARHVDLAALSRDFGSPVRKAA